MLGHYVHALTNFKLKKEIIMENKRFFETDPKTLVAKYNEALKVINKKIEKENWRITGEIWMPNEESMIQSIRNGKYSKSERKVLRNRINRVLQKPGLRNINTLTHAKVKVSEQEEKIQSARKKWKVAQSISEQLMEEYKTLKGDFYKR